MWIRILDLHWNKMDLDPGHEHFFKIYWFFNRRSFFITVRIWIFVRSFWLIFSHLDLYQWISIFLRIRIQEAKMLRIQRVWILITACLYLRVAGLDCLGDWALCRLWSSRTESATLNPRRPSISPPRFPSSSSSSSLWSRWGGGGGRNSILPRGVVLLLPGSTSSSRPPSWLAAETRRIGGGGLPAAWDILRRKIVPPPRKPR